MERPDQPESTAPEQPDEVAPEKLPPSPSNLAGAVVLACVGGLLDSTVYVLHGHVFATAMTGNVVLMGIALLSRQYLQSARHLVPLAAFALGVAATRVIIRTKNPGALRTVIFLEAAGLTVVGALPMTFSSGLLVAMVAATAAVQIAAFRRLGDTPYVTTFLTGNMRDAFESIVDVALPGRLPAESRDRARRQVREFGFICFGFLMGVLLGAGSAPHLQNFTFWIGTGLLVAAAVLFRRPLKKDGPPITGRP